MKIEVDIALEGLSEVLADAMPDGITPLRVQLTRSELRVEFRAKVAVLSKRMALTADVLLAKGTARIHGFQLQGALGLGGRALDHIRTKVSRLDARWGQFRVKGDARGDELEVSWET